MSSTKRYLRPAERSAFMAIVIWAAIAVVVIGLRRLPTLEILSVSLAMAFVMTCVNLTWRKRWSYVQWSWPMVAIGAFAVSGTSALYITAFKLAPPVHVELLMYIWPIVVLLANTCFFHEKITWRTVLSVCLGVLALLSLHSDLGQWSMGTHYYAGYGCVLLAAMTWSLYNVYTKYNHALPAEMMGLYCGVGWLVLFPLHCIQEITLLPSYQEWMLLLVMGIASQWYAYQAWDYAVKQQRAATMASLAYITPVLSVFLLTCFGYGAWNVSLVSACILMTLSHMLVRTHQAE